MESNNSKIEVDKETVFTPIARGEKIEAPEMVSVLDGILSDTFKKHYFSEIKNKKNKKNKN